MNHLPKRKNIRLKNYDYSQPGYYFITICTKDKECLLSKIVTNNLGEMPNIILSPIGMEIEKSLNYIEENNLNINFDKYVIMPNHLHIILVLKNNSINGENNSIDRVIGQLKSYTNKKYNEFENGMGLILWQRNYYEQIIRDDLKYREIWNYIDSNPLEWIDDKYYKK